MSYVKLFSQVKRTSLWNKACEELRKHQEFIAKVQQNPEFLKEPFGDPFSGEDLKAQLGGGEDSDDSDSDDEGFNNHDDMAVSPPPKGRNALPFYSDGEEDDSDNEGTIRKSKSQKFDLKKQKSQRTSSLNSSEIQSPTAANGGSLSQKSPLATATKTLPPSLLSSKSSLISPRNDKNEEKLTGKDKKLSKKKQKELYQQQQQLLEEAKAKANAKVNTSETEKGDEILNGSSLKKKRGRPKKNKTEDDQDEERIASSAHSPNSSMVSSQVSTTNK